MRKARAPAFAQRYGPFAVVAGASEGIGAAFSHELAAAGLNLVLVARRAAPLETLGRELRASSGVEVRTLACDLAEPEAADAIAGVCRGLEVGLLVYNAAASAVGRFLDTPLGAHLRAVEVNARGPVLLAHAFGRRMAERGRGGIVLMSSLTAFQGTPLVATYGATKAFNLVFAEGLASELKERGVDVLACCAGATLTPGYSRATPPRATGPFAPRPQDPRDVAREALDALGHRAIVVTGRANRLASFVMRRVFSRRLAVATIGSEMRRRYLAAALIAATLSPAAFAWGPIGHRMIAETAALLVEDDLPATWGPLIARHRFELGVYAFLPDARFRHVDGADGKVEAPTHYLELDGPGEKAARDGSVDRRIVQFLESARTQLHDVRAPTGGYGRGATASGDARRVYLGLYELGVMSHYSGDASMPYHATADRNGFAQGEGGIHFYFESDCVNALEPGLATDVLALARKHRRRWLEAWKAHGDDPAALVTAVLEESLATVAKVSKLDRLHAVTAPQAPGSTLSASRKPPSEGCRSMRPVLVLCLARGAVLTSVLWETALPKGVDFSGASDLQFSDMELAPEYVPPRP